MRGEATKRAVQSDRCLDKGCESVSLRYEARPEHATIFLDNEVALVKGRRLVSPLMEYRNEDGILVLTMAEWLEVVDYEPLAHGCRLTVLRGVNLSQALQWPASTVFHVLPVAA